MELSRYKLKSLEIVTIKLVNFPPFQPLTYLFDYLEETLIIKIQL